MAEVKTKYVLLATQATGTVRDYASIASSPVAFIRVSSAPRFDSQDDAVKWLKNNTSVLKEVGPVVIVPICKLE